MKYWLFLLIPAAFIAAIIIIKILIRICLNPYSGWEIMVFKSRFKGIKSQLVRRILTKREHHTETSLPSCYSCCFVLCQDRSHIRDENYYRWSEKNGLLFQNDPSYTRRNPVYQVYNLKPSDRFILRTIFRLY